MERSYLIEIKLRGEERDIDYILKDIYKLSEYEEVTAMHVKEMYVKEEK